MEFDALQNFKAHKKPEHLVTTGHIGNISCEFPDKITLITRDTKRNPYTNNNTNLL